MTDKVVLSVRGLCKKYGKRIAVNNLSFDIHEGEIFGFLGPNGAGKSTAIKMITGLAKMKSGEVLICGHSIKKQFEKAISLVGGIIENPEMYNNLSGRNNLEFYARLSGVYSPQKIDDVGKIVGLTSRLKDKVGTYSLGMKQRLGIAQALLHDPKLLILDEPTNGLDPEGIVDLRKFLRRLANDRKIAILISSHNLAEMELMCDTVGIINLGYMDKILHISSTTKEDGEQVSIQINFPNYAGKLILEKYGKRKISIVKNTITVDISHDKIPEITALLVNNGISIYSISEKKQNLESIFLETINKRALPSPKSNY